MKNCYRKKGFTLIELMLVITIILILMGFLIPKISAYQDKARTTKAINTAKQIQTAAMTSYGNNDSEFDADDVTKTVKELTSVEGNPTVNSDSKGQDIDITYESDGKSYAVDIDAEHNTFTVKCGEKQIFPKESNTPPPPPPPS